MWVGRAPSVSGARSTSLLRGTQESVDLFDQMRTFVRIVETGSLSAAARGRKLSLAAVSRQLSALEGELEASLVARSTRRLQITPSGQRWYEHCVRMLRELELARADVADSPEPRGVVTISAPVAFGMAHVVPRLERLQREHPGLEIELRLQDQLIDLVGEATDIAVRVGSAPPDSASVIARPLLEFRRNPVASRSYLRKHGVPRHPSELAGHAGLGQVGAGPWRFARDGEVVEVSPAARLRSSSPSVLREWAVAGAGIALLPSWLVGDGLVVLFEDWTTPSAHVWALHRVGLRAATRVRAVLDAL